MLLIDLMNINGCTNPAHSTIPAFSPYPNQSSFLLGDWYWNGGVQKSQKCFSDLIDIIVDPKFSKEIFKTSIELESIIISHQMIK